MIHLTYTGVYAGTLLCGKARKLDDAHAHAVYAPLHKDEYRATVCPVCLKYYALDAYDDTDDDMPDWVKTIREGETV
jgi:hypothetical protein